MTTTIYTTPTCAYCKAAKEFFKKNNVQYSEIDITTDPAQMDVMIKKSGQMGVPVIVAEKDGQEEIIVGFDQARLAKLASA